MCRTFSQAWGVKLEYDCKRSLPSPSVGIIGAGPAGLTAAYLLSANGILPEVWEADTTYVGGISRTVVHKGFRFDIGGHRFFSKSQEIEDLWSEVLPYDMLTCDRLSRIYYGGKFYSYPLDIGEVVENLGRRVSFLTLASYVKAKFATNSNPNNFEEWVTRKFGGRLFQMFFKSYTEKVWGIPCSEISADWAAQRIKGLSLTKAARNALLTGRQQGSRGMSRNRSEVIKTLITSFRYPRLGPGMMWEAAAQKVLQRGGQIHMGARVKSIERNAKGGWLLTIATAQESSLTKEFDIVISSAPLGWLVGNLKPAMPLAAVEAAKSLRYRDFLTVALIVRPDFNFPDNWIYIHDPDLRVGRIQNFANWSPEMVPDPTLVCYGMEYFCNSGDDLWERSNVELIALATQELEVLKLVRQGQVVDGAVVRQPKAYPVYDNDYAARRATIRSSLKEHCPGLHVVGRNGMHQYNNQDHSMMTAILTVKNILADQDIYDVWNVNQDAEYLEEQTKEA